MSELKPYGPILNYSEGNGIPTANGLPTPDQLMSCPIDKLQPHPAFIRHRFGPSPDEIAGLEKLGERAFLEPFLITQDFLIVDGYSRWRYARQVGQTMASCIQRTLTEEGAILEILRGSQRRSGVNDYNRIVMALDIEPWLQERALSNQRLGGQAKGSSNLTDLDRVDVRAGIARAANVSTGNVTKVKQINQFAEPSVLSALQTGEIQIHRAWAWSKKPFWQQKQDLRNLRRQRGIHRDIRSLAAKHRSKANQIGKGFKHLGNAIAIFKEELNSPMLTATLEDLYAGLHHQNNPDGGRLNA